ncbi:hypothetical protein AM218_06190 [Hymenobacter sp. DG25A]|nr:hypothetical protein AM218_06190 [Hymenobacter sp. DG25A]
MYWQFPVPELAAYLREERWMQESFPMIDFLFPLIIGVLNSAEEISSSQYLPLTGKQTKFNGRTNNSFKGATNLTIKLTSSHFNGTLTTSVIYNLSNFPRTIIRSTGIINGFWHEAKWKNKERYKNSKKKQYMKVVLSIKQYRIV